MFLKLWDASPLPLYARAFGFLGFDPACGCAARWALRTGRHANERTFAGRAHRGRIEYVRHGKTDEDMHEIAKPRPWAMGMWVLVGGGCHVRSDTAEVTYTWPGSNRRPSACEAEGTDSTLKLAERVGRSDAVTAAR